MSTPTGIQCPATAIRSFPVGLSITPTTEMLDAVVEPLSFTFNWKPRTTPPQFKGTENGEILDDLSTSVLFNGRTYSLYSVQLTNPTHLKWITPYTQQVKNEEDIILTFSYQDLLSNEPQYIIFVIPVIRSQVLVGDPSYLVKFVNPTGNPDQEISLQSLIPARKSEPFLYYRTCCQGFSVNTPPQNVLVVVAAQGLYVSQERMIAVKRIFEQSAVRTDYGPYKGPLTLNFEGSFTISTPELFRERVKVTREVLSPVDPNTAPGPILPEVQMETKSYQCVTLDPEKQVDENGKIRIDPNKGVPLTSVQAEREAEKKDIIESKTKITAEIFNQYVSSALGIFFAGIILSVVIFFMLGALVGPRAVGDGATFYQRLLTRMSKVPAYSVIGILAGFTGFLIGMVFKYR